MPAEVVIDPRFRGPSDSGNGGYTCGLLAAAIDGPAEVTLRIPPPLDRPLRIEHTEEGAALLDGGDVVAQARPATVDVDVPAPVTIAEAVAAAERYPWRDRHPYPACFVCGPERTPGDGLCIYPGPVAGRDIFAAPWTPDPSLADGGGGVRPEFVWAAIDCPGGIVTDLLGEHGRLLLGRLTADLRAPVRAHEPHVAVAWPIERDGRKLHTGTALFAAGETTPAAVARAVWIEVAG